jgi:hypothetical protein
VPAREIEHAGAGDVAEQVEQRAGSRVVDLVRPTVGVELGDGVVACDAVAELVMGRA